MQLRIDANAIMQAALASALPDNAVCAALDQADFGTGKLVLVAAGKAAWQMAKAAADRLGERINSGVVVTKYNHSKGEIFPFTIYEAGHPVPDKNSFRATQAAIDAVSDLQPEDTVLFLLSGGGSALFEKPLIPEENLNRLTKELLACGADIVEMNTVRKRFSAVKGGRFAEICQPAKVFTIVLSDVLGDKLDMIASGPAYPDSSTAEDAKAIVRKYNLTLTAQMKELLEQETPKTLDNVETHITGSVRQLCAAAEAACRHLGYEPVVLTDQLTCVARDAGVFLSSIAKTHAGSGRKLAYLAGGETVVHLTGHGKGGRNQEIALAAAEGIAGLDACVFSLGSDGTDGPTDAAGGITDGTTCRVLKDMGIIISDVLQDNDAYNALAKCDGLIMTGPTGTNVNDISVLLIGG
ncbi:MAG: DUF4147 domain-containing protein [Oscillospiraceae bacterium]|nr:DUF4147 domain-containing protein [Oscillospiraceae bacterium]